ncbi:MAG: hypothetical protein LBU65_10730 [Planctomycetaceae bacterium]|jgi:hypothetical protein|nr:hypothetical protein [Planctomycetaceae bacterium]
MSKTCFTLIFTFLLYTAVATTAAENIASQAKVTASNEFNGDYVAAFAVNSSVPNPLGQNDKREAWCVNGQNFRNGNGVRFTLEWDLPQNVVEVVYFGRTAWMIEECFKDYEVFIDGSETPITKGTLQKKHGAQRIKLPQTVECKKLTLQFLNSYTDTYNPGASEIAVYSVVPADGELAKFTNEKRTSEENALAEKVISGGFGFKDVLVVERKPLQTSHVYTYHVEGFKPGGGLRIYSPETDKLKTVVDAGDGMIIDADLHWNGTEVVFSWKKKGKFIGSAASVLEDVSIHSNPDENYQVYTVNIDGTNLRQITNAPYNNLNACWLPDGGIAFISDRKPAYAYCWVTTSPVLYRMERDGSKAKRLSANYLMDFTPSVLNDGRIIFTRWEYVDRCACPIQSLWTINPDGSNLAGYFKNRMIAPGTFMDANAIPDSRKIFALATNHNGSCVGGIVRIDRNFGANAEAGVLNTTPEVDIFKASWCWGNGLSGPYEKPFALDENTYLVTKSGDVQVRTTNGSRATLLVKNEAAGNGYYSVQPIREYPLPPVVKSGTANGSLALPEDGRVSGNWAVVTMQDVYNGLEPTVKRGEVKRIAVVQEVEKSTRAPLQVPCSESQNGLMSVQTFGFQFPVVSCGATYAAKKVWGFADVADDGSATFKVPSEVPIYFMALDDEGRAVQRMRTFTHLMPGEVQGCVGCHVDRNTQTPTRGHRTTLANTEIQELQKPSWGVKGFSYLEVVQPVLDKYCVECHNPKETGTSTSAKGKRLDLTGDLTDFFCASYDNLARKGTLGENNWLDGGVPRDSRREGVSPYTSWIWTINGAEWNTLEVAPKRWGSPASLLADLLRNGHPDENGMKRIEVPQADREKVYLWIDLNVPYYPTSSSNHPLQLGSRRMYPTELDAVLHDVSVRRCGECHNPNLPNEIDYRRGSPHIVRSKEKPLPREFYTKFMNPENNSFLLAPLAKEAGGTQKCGKPVFETKDDPDYKKIIDTFKPIQMLVTEKPRADMPEFVEPPCRVVQ